MRVLFQALKIILEVQRKKSNERITRGKISFQTYNRCSFFFSSLFSAHANYEHSRPGQVCDMLPVPEDNLSSMIYLSSNELAGPKRMLNCKQ
jgi:hypothetical protein